MSLSIFHNNSITVLLKLGFMYWFYYIDSYLLEGQEHCSRYLIVFSKSRHFDIKSCSFSNNFRNKMKRDVRVVQYARDEQANNIICFNLQ